MRKFRFFTAITKYTAVFDLPGRLRDICGDRGRVRVSDKV
jgi:hypothetical protein